jgi:hypothetical protein
MRIDSSGNVGIGTSSIDSSLHIQKNHAALTEITIENETNSGSADTGLHFKNFATNSGTHIKFSDWVGTAGRIGYEHQTNYLYFNVNADTERMRINSSGHLLVGKTADDNTTAGIAIHDNGFMSVARSNNIAMILERDNDGEILRFTKVGSTIGGIYSSPSITGPFIGHINVGLAMYHVGNSVLPSGTGGLRDNAIDLGNSFNRFDDIYATNSTIQTSDRNEKQDIEELSEAEQRVAVVAKGLMRKFRWIDSVAEKGDNARTHFGIIAQDLQDAFTAEGLDAGDYAMFTSTTCWEKEISVDAVEADEENGIEAQEAYTYRKIAEEATEGYTERTRLGVRYNQLLAFIISAI